MPHRARSSAMLTLCDVDLDVYRAEHARGLRTSALPYGIDRLEERGLELVSVPVRAPGKILSALEHRSGMRLAQPLRALGPARRTSAVLAILEHWAELPAVLRRTPFTPYHGRPLVTLACWAAEDLAHGTESRRRHAMRALRGSDLVAFWSRNQAATYTEHGIPGDRLLPIPFGTETAFFDGDPDADRPIPFLSVGMDRGRDYGTLAAAARGSGHVVELLAPDSSLAGIDLPPEVVRRSILPPREYADLLRRTKVVVVPTLSLAYPTGQTVALDAAASGCAVVVTSTPAMAEYFTDDVTALMPPVGDASALRRALDRLAGDDAFRRGLAHRGREHVRRFHDSSRMWDILADELERRGWVTGAG